MSSLKYANARKLRSHQAGHPQNSTFKSRQRSQLQESNQRRPMFQSTAIEQAPMKIGEDCYLVKQEFRYVHPLEYRIQFAETAVFASGCLTCGNENACVENYGERYCCQSCQKSL